MGTGTERDQIEAAHAMWDAAFNARDARGLAALYLPDATFLPATHEVIEGPIGIERFFGGIFADGLTGHRFELITTHSDGVTLVAAARWTVRGRDADGAPATFAGIATHVFVRQPDGSASAQAAHLQLTRSRPRAMPGPSGTRAGADCSRPGSAPDLAGLERELTRRATTCARPICWTSPTPRCGRCGCGTTCPMSRRALPCRRCSWPLLRLDRGSMLANLVLRRVAAQRADVRLHPAEPLRR